MGWLTELIEILPINIEVSLILFILAIPVAAFFWEYVHTQPGEKVVIFGKPIVTKPARSSDMPDLTQKVRFALVVGDNVRALREANGVSELRGLEVGKLLNELPNGKFGFSPPWMINTNPVGVVGGTGLDRLTLGRKGGTGVMEVHKSSEGVVYVVGYLSDEILVRAQDSTRTTPISATLFFEPNAGRSPVAIPEGMILSSENRSTENDEGNRIYVNELQLG